MSDKLNLIETIAKDPKFSTFSKMLETSGAKEFIAGTGEYTVFVPTNDAFGKIPDNMMNELLSQSDQGKLKSILSYHILPKKVWAAEAPGLGVTKTVNGQEVRFTNADGIKVNGAAIQSRNIEASNGLIHAIDTVLAPPMAASGNTSLL